MRLPAQYKLLALLFAIVSELLSAQSARADIIPSSISGQYTAINPPTGNDQTSFTLTNGTVTFPTAITGDVANDLLVDVTAYNPPGGNSGVGLNDTSVKPQFIVTDAFDTTKMMIFDLANPAILFTNDPSLATGSIAVGMTLDPASPGLPAFNQNVFAVSDLFIDFSGIEVLATTAEGLPDGRASWSGKISATFEIEAVPEPSTLGLALVCGLVVAANCWIQRRGLLLSSN
jgi:hypothetical protein